MTPEEIKVVGRDLLDQYITYVCLDLIKKEDTESKKLMLSHAAPDSPALKAVEAFGNPYEK